MKQDFLRECMEEVRNVPIDQFSQAFCVVCANSDCSRSRANSTLFNIRIMNWEKDLFTNIPRADPHSELAKSVSKQWGGILHLNTTSDPTPTKFVSEPEKTRETPLTVETQKEITEIVKPKKVHKKKTEQTLKNSDSTEGMEVTTVVPPDETSTPDSGEKSPLGARPTIDNPFSIPVSHVKEPEDGTVLEVGGTFVLD